MVLVHSTTHIPVSTGETLVSSKGIEWRLIGTRQPFGNSSGRVYVERELDNGETTTAEYYPSVFDLEWISEPRPRPTLEPESGPDRDNALKHIMICEADYLEVSMNDLGNITEYVMCPFGWINHYLVKWVDEYVIYQWQDGTMHRNRQAGIDRD
jgi:hypothetical protein